MKPTSTLLLAALLGGGKALAQVPCPTLPADHISRFTSVEPTTQPQDLRIPATHTFQMLAQGNMPYTNAADGNMLEAFDFTGYAPIAGSSTNGYLSINHEGSGTTSGVSMLSLNFNAATKLWNVTAKHPVNFGSVVGTINNCSGTVTPWSTIVTCEENTGPTTPTDTNNDGYMDSGWNVEIDPVTHTVKDQNGDGTPDKLWKMGRLKHENIVVAADQRTAYEGADDGSSNSFVYKYVATTAGQLGNGTLYALQLNGAIGTGTAGTWIQIPNSTPAECNNTTAAARALGATSFNGVEDIEISPLTGQVYFTAKGPGTIYRFTDTGATGTTFSNFEIFAGNTPTNTAQAYTINYGSGTISELWRTGNDNLTFDSQGNLYVLQDGGRNHVWLIKPCHTQANPAVEVFAVTPAGCEPTGMTLSPDERFIFISMQSPDANTQATVDAAGQSVVFNKSTAVVIARKGVLGTALSTKNGQAELAKADVYPNPVNGSELTLQLSHNQKEAATLTVYNALGARVFEQAATLSQGQNTLKLPVSKLQSGHYNLVITTATTTTTRPFIKQ
ncbi:alkaline phosphatase PhoX [Hymenobacter norwichensis]|uniref:alkaline phosphatase PhoX n=1 Tax=Hymenobacter norwichensis TaxID=223903 RepID=UPI0003B48A24|nr:alkaline phosphatase PhoX [Hymenobacter norwichensis]